MGRIPLGLKLALSVFAALYVPAYLAEYGPLSFLWFCNLGNLLLVAALWIESAFLVSLVAVSVLLAQVLWGLDFLGRCVLGFHPIGGTSYMWKAEIPLWIRGLSLFHLAVPPLLVFALRRLGYDRRSLPAQTLLCWILLPACYFFTPPERDLNWVFGLFDRPQDAMPGGLFLLLMMAGYPLLLYLPAHLALSRTFGRPSDVNRGRLARITPSNANVEGRTGGIP